MTTPRLALPELLQDTKSGYVTFNDLGRILDAVFVTAVQHYVLVDPPADPIEGQCWYVPVSATGAWVGQDKDIAHWFNGMWYFHTPQPGMPVYLVPDGAPAYIDENGDIVSVAPPTYEYQDLVLFDSPLAYWPLDDTGGTTIQEIASGHNGTISGGYVLGQSPLVVERMAISVTSAHMTAAISASGTTYTLEAWVKPTSTMSGYHIIMHEPGTGFYVTGEKLDFYFGSSSHLATTVLSVGETYHCVLVVDAGEGTFYLNGVADGSVSGCPAFNPVNFFGSGSEPLVADVDELAFYQVALTVDQVQAHYQTGVLYREFILASNPDAYYTMDQGLPTPLTDEVNAYDIALTGGPALTRNASLLRKPGGSFNFPSGTIGVPGFGSADGSFAFELWLQAVPTGLQTILIESGRALYVNGTNLGWYYGNMKDCPTQLIDGKVYHVVVNATSGVVEINLNGILELTDAIDTFNPANIFSSIGGAPYTIKGLVDHFVWFDRTLTAQEIQDHFWVGATNAARYEHTVLKDSPVAYYSFGEASGDTAHDNTKNAYDATFVTVDPTWGVDSPMGYGTGISVINQRATMSLGMSGTTYSVEMWVRPNVVTGLNLLFRDSGDTALYINSGVLDFRFSSTGHPDTTPIVVGAKYHVVFSVDAGVGTYYINGAPGVTTVNGCPAFSPARLFSSSTNQYFLDASADEVAIFDTALSAQQVSDHYAAGTPGIYRDVILADTPLSYYPLNERTGTVVEDMAGSADGTLSGIVNIGVAPLVQEGTAYDMDTNKIVAAIGASGDTWTFECWIKPDVLVNDYQALANQSLETGLGIYLYSDRLAFYLGGNYYSDTTIVVGTRYHVVFSVDAGAGTWYLNGVPDGTVAGVPEFNPVAFGANIGDVQYYNGVYDQIAFYQTALTAQQVLNHYTTGGT